MNIKQLKRTPPTTEKPLLVVCEEKHGDNYFLITSFDGYLKFCVELVSERNDNDFDYYFDLNDIDPPVEPEIPRKQAEEMKNSSLREAALKAWDIYDREVSSNRHMLRQAELLKKAKAGCGESAHALLMERSDYEYENISFENPQIYK